ncbi:hypothetical protein ACHAQF_004178 [Verticillium nonalfalfae]
MTPAPANPPTTAAFLRQSSLMAPSPIDGASHPKWVMVPASFGARPGELLRASADKLKRAPEA